MGLNTSHPCPDCGNKTLTKRGITVQYNSGRQGGATWLNCINCDWDNKGRDRCDPSVPTRDDVPRPATECNRSGGAE